MLGKPLRFVGVEQVAPFGKLLAVLPDHPGHGLGAGGTLAAFLGRCVEAGDGVGQGGHDLRCQPTGCRSLTQQVRLVEAAHDQDPLDDFRIATGGPATQRQAAAILCHRHDLEVEVGGGPAVDLQLAAAGLAALLQGREVHVGVTDGALHLVGARAGQEDDGAVRVDALDLAHPAAVGRRVAEQPQHRRLIVGDVASHLLAGFLRQSALPGGAVGAYLPRRAAH